MVFYLDKPDNPPDFDKLKWLFLKGFPNLKELKTKEFKLI